MKYSIDGTNWVDITGTTAVIESGVTTGTIIKIYMPGNGTTTIDSDVQEIEVPQYYKVTFVPNNGGNEIPPQYVLSGEKAAEPAEPVREGMDFNGWYMDDEFEYAFDYSNPISMTSRSMLTGRQLSDWVFITVLIRVRNVVRWM